MSAPVNVIVVAEKDPDKLAAGIVTTSSTLYPVPGLDTTASITST